VPPPSHLTSCTPNKSNLYFEISSPYPERTCPVHASDIPCTKSHVHFLSLRSFIQGIRPGPRSLLNVRNKLIFLLWGVVSLTPNLQAGGPRLLGCPRLLIRYIRSYPTYLEAISSIRNMSTRLALVTRDLPNIALRIIMKIILHILLYTLWDILHNVSKRSILISMHVRENYVQNCYHSFHTEVAFQT
jgi:hypothetical protein